jgi:hypothetical protein
MSRGRRLGGWAGGSLKISSYRDSRGKASVISFIPNAAPPEFHSLEAVGSRKKTTPASCRGGGGGGGGGAAPPPPPRAPPPRGPRGGGGARRGRRRPPPPLRGAPSGLCRHGRCQHRLRWRWPRPPSPLLLFTPLLLFLPFPSLPLLFHVVAAQANGNGFIWPSPAQIM